MPSMYSTTRIQERKSKRDVAHFVFIETHCIHAWTSPTCSVAQHRGPAAVFTTTAVFVTFGSGPRWLAVLACRVKGRWMAAR